MIWGYHYLWKHPYRENFVESRLTIGWIRIHETGNVTLPSSSKAIFQDWRNFLTKLVENLHDFFVTLKYIIMSPGKSNVVFFFCGSETLGSDLSVVAKNGPSQTFTLPKTPEKLNGWNPSKSKVNWKWKSSSIHLHFRVQLMLITREQWTTAVCWFSRPMSFNLWRATGTREDPLEKRQEMTDAIGPLVHVRWLLLVHW